MLDDPSPNTPKTAVVMVTAYLGYEHDRVQHGGRPRMVRDVAYMLRDLGFSVTIAQKGSQDRIVLLDDKIAVRKYKVPVRSWSDVLFAFRTRDLVKASDVCCYASCEDGFPFFAKRSFGIQHGIWWDKPYGSFVTRILVSQFQFWRLAALCKSAARVVCVDTNVINWLRLHGSAGHKAAEKCTYLPNYLDTAVFPPPSNSLIKARFHSRHLIYVRRFERPRGALLFVEICKLLRDRGFKFSASMIGWGNEKATVSKLIEKYGLKEIIQIAEVHFETVSDVLRTATIAIVPTIYSEGTSLSCIEAIGMGIPVVTTDVGGLGNLVIPGFNGYIVKASAAQLATSVQTALSNLDHYMRLATNCVQMRDMFAFGRWRENVIQILRESGLLRAPQSEAPIPAAIETTRA